MLTRNMPHRVEARRLGAQLRLEERAKRDDSEQLAYLEMRGHESCRETSRLRERIARAALEATAPAPAVPEGQTQDTRSEPRAVPAGESKKVKRARARRQGRE